MTNELDGQVALVTGSSRGIGAAIAAELASRGAAVAADGGKTMPVTGDVTDFGQVEALRRQVEADLGPVDILVANAGGSLTPPAPLEDIPEDGWRATVDVNLLGTFLTLKSFLPGMGCGPPSRTPIRSSASARRGTSPPPSRSSPRQRRPGSPASSSTWPAARS